MRVVNPSPGEAVEVARPVSGVSPQSPLECVRGGASVARFAYVIAARVVEAIDGMFPASPSFLQRDAFGLSYGAFVIEHHYIAAQIFLVVYQRQNVGLAKIRESRVVQHPLDLGSPPNLRAFAFQPREHAEFFVRGQLKRPRPIRFETDRNLRVRYLVDYGDVFFPRFRAVQVFADVNGAKVVHVLVDEFRHGYLRQVAMRLVADEAHGEYVAERRLNQGGMFAQQQLQAIDEVPVCVNAVHADLRIARFSRRFAGTGRRRAELVGDSPSFSRSAPGSTPRTTSAARPCSGRATLCLSPFAPALAVSCARRRGRGGLRRSPPPLGAFPPW